MPFIKSQIATLCTMLFLGLAGCSTSTEPAYYLLGPSGSTTTETPQAGVSERVIGLRELALPLYVRRTQIASVGPDGAVTLSDDHRWAEEAPRAATRVVGRTLTSLTGDTVVLEPWPTGIEPNVRADIEVDYFAGALGGELRLAGQYRIVRSDGTKPTTRTFNLVEQATVEGYEGLVEAHRRALVALAGLIATELR